MVSMKKNYYARVGPPLFGKLFASRENRRPEIGHGASKPLSNGRSVWLLGERTRQVYVVLFRGSKYRLCVKNNVCLMTFAFVSTFGLEEKVN